ncbi:MAG TPA: histidine kinase [Xanthomonadaceae bacterium]|nr:histidine kinase [Xanthomonadaceae bacterium]
MRLPAPVRSTAYALQRIGTSLRQRLLPAALDPGAMPFFSLVYLSFLGVPFLFGPPGVVSLAPTLASIAVFLPLYFAFYWARGWQRAGLLLAIAALAVPLFPFNWFSSAFLVYSNVLAVFLRWHQMLLVLLVSQALWALGVAMTEMPFGFFVFLGLFTGLLSALGNWVWMNTSRRNAALRLTQDEVRRLAAVAERERIGRDLHDLLGHTLSVVALKSELASKLIGRDANAAHREIVEVGQVARDALAQVRSAVTGIRRMLLPAELASARLALDTVQVEFRYEARHDALPSDIETVLALALREAVTNVMRHARARHCRALVECIDTTVRLIVDDDGVGVAGGDGQGLRGMRERAEALGGRIEVSVSPMGGARVTVELPLPVESASTEAASLVAQGAPRPA